MSVDDHGLEVLKKAGLDVGATPKSNYAIQVIGKNGDPLPVSGTVGFSPSGLRNGGRVTEVTINDSSWTALPVTALSNRNAISIQNRSGFEVKLNYTSSVGYVGMVLPNGYERHYDITDAVIIYARSTSGSGSIILSVEEIS